jgi:hypothetical protein
MLGNICAARDQLAIVPFAVYPVLAVIWMAIRRTTLREVQDTYLGTLMTYWCVLRRE